MNRNFNRSIYNSLSLFFLFAISYTIQGRYKQNNWIWSIKKWNSITKQAHVIYFDQCSHIQLSVRCSWDEFIKCVAHWHMAYVSVSVGFYSPCLFINSAQLAKVNGKLRSNHPRSEHVYSILFLFHYKFTHTYTHSILRHCLAWNVQIEGQSEICKSRACMFKPFNELNLRH